MVKIYSLEIIWHLRRLIRRGGGVLFLLAPLYCHDASQMENRNMVMVVVVDFTINEIYVLYNGCFYIFWVCWL